MMTGKTKDKVQRPSEGGYIKQNGEKDNIKTREALKNSEGIVLLQST
jgi:hypothetical protein